MRICLALTDAYVVIPTLTNEQVEERLVGAILAPLFYIKLFLTPLQAEAAFGGRHLRPLSSPLPLALTNQPMLLTQVALALSLHLSALCVLFRVNGVGTGKTPLHQLARRLSVWWVGFIILLLPTLGLSGHHATDLFAADRYFCECFATH